MSSPIWTPDELLSNAKPLETNCWRLVEAQHRVSTLKLVDSLEEQELLEDIIEATKPPLVIDAHKSLHYLLSTPFRYPNPFGSRFREANEPDGVFYASEGVETAVAEMAFHRLLFFAESPETPWPTEPCEFTAFPVAIEAKHCLDLTSAPFNKKAASWQGPEDYCPCQNIARQARQAGIEAIRYRSARDPNKGVNLAILSPSIFKELDLCKARTWMIVPRQTGVIAKCLFPQQALEYNQEAFSADSRIKRMVWNRSCNIK